MMTRIGTCFVYALLQIVPSFATRQPTTSPTAMELPIAHESPVPTAVIFLPSDTPSPTRRVTQSPTAGPQTSTPTPVPTARPTKTPTTAPPTARATGAPTFSPTAAPQTAQPTSAPTAVPTSNPTATPQTSQPTAAPSPEPAYNVSNTTQPSASLAPMEVVTIAPTPAPTTPQPTPAASIVPVLVGLNLTFTLEGFGDNFDWTSLSNNQTIASVLEAALTTVLAIPPSTIESLSVLLFNDRSPPSPPTSSSSTSSSSSSTSSTPPTSSSSSRAMSSSPSTSSSSSTSSTSSSGALSSPPPPPPPLPPVLQPPITHISDSSSSGGDVPPSASNNLPLHKHDRKNSGSSSSSSSGDVMASSGSSKLPSDNGSGGGGGGGVVVVVVELELRLEGSGYADAEEMFLGVTTEAEEAIKSGALTSAIQQTAMDISVPALYEVTVDTESYEMPTKYTVNGVTTSSSILWAPDPDDTSSVSMYIVAPCVLGALALFGAMVVVSRRNAGQRYRMPGDPLAAAGKPLSPAHKYTRAHGVIDSNSLNDDDDDDSDEGVDDAEYEGQVEVEEEEEQDVYIEDMGPHTHRQSSLDQNPGGKAAIGQDDPGFLPIGAGGPEQRLHNWTMSDVTMSDVANDDGAPASLVAGEGELQTDVPAALADMQAEAGAGDSNGL